jgi:hypothetical protein
MAGQRGPAAHDCLSTPNRSAPDRKHWYYRIDRENNNRKCWYLGPQGEKVRVTTRHRPGATKSAKSAPREVAAPTERPVAPAVAAGISPSPASQVEARWVGPPTNVDPVPTLRPAVITPVDNPAVSPLERVIGESVADAASSEATAIDLNPMLALLTGGLVIAGIGLLTVKRPTSRIALRVRSDRLVRNAVRRSAPHQSILPILAKAPVPGFGQSVLAPERAQEKHARAKQVEPLRQLELQGDRAEPVDPLEQLELLVREITQTATAPPPERHELSLDQTGLKASPRKRLEKNRASLLAKNCWGDSILPPENKPMPALPSG